MRTEMGWRPLDLDRARSIAAALEQRYLLKAGTEYLHWSGRFLTPDRRQAWQGTKRQMLNARRVFAAAAECRAVKIRQPQIVAAQDA